MDRYDFRWCGLDRGRHPGGNTLCGPPQTMNVGVQGMGETTDDSIRHGWIGLVGIITGGALRTKQTKHHSAQRVIGVAMVIVVDHGLQIAGSIFPCHIFSPKCCGFFFQATDMIEQVIQHLRAIDT